jgi:hypothetical protein
MSAVKIGDYDEMGVWVVRDLADFRTAVDHGQLAKGLSVALILGERDESTADVLTGVAAAIAELCPTLVHCFGACSEAAHDMVDSALLSRGQEGVRTFWSVECEPAAIIFEFFRTDQPPERDYDRWSGRLVILDECLGSEERDSIITGLGDVDGTVELYLRNGV